MRFSLGKRGEDEDAERPSASGSAGPTGNGSGSSSGSAASVDAPTRSHDGPTRSHGAPDEPAPLNGLDDGPRSGDGRRDGRDDAPADHGQNGGNGNGAQDDDDDVRVHAGDDGGGAGASQTLQSSAMPDHMPIGEGPTPRFDESQTQEAGLAVPGAGSDAGIPTEDPEDTFTEDEVRGEPDRSSRVSVIDEEMVRPSPPAGATEEEYKWHTYKVYPSGRPDAVEFIDTYRAFGKNRILRGLNMGLPEGMVSMILGPSGTGKSVCIKHMVGLLYPDQGDVLVHGRSVPNMVDDELFEMRKKFGLLFQDGALFGSMNLYDNVAFPLRQHTEKGEDEIEDIVMGRLNEVGLGHSRTMFPNELSGGMRKRAGFARALVLGPDVVLFDEPDSGLDPVRTSLLGELILEVHRDMMDEAKSSDKPHLPTFCVITHNVMMARRTADYINVLWKGRIVEAGPTEDMLNSANPFIRQFLAGESMGPLTMD